jgi:DNA adenine methylase
VLKASLPPAIKWSGSKRSIAPHLGLLVPRAGCFYDPFVGGGSMLVVRKTHEAIAGDTVPELIALWKLIQSAPDDLVEKYTLLWNRLQIEGHTVFYEVRDRFNESRAASDFFFLSRTCVNGLIRFNSKGNFNNSLHHTRPGIAPGRLAKVLRQWSAALRGVRFEARDYRETLERATANDVAFLDPPYAATRGRYHTPEFELSPFFETLGQLNARGVRWVLTYDGQAGTRIYGGEIPADLWKHRLEAPTGRSPFTRLMRTSLDTVVESIYVNFDPPFEVRRHFAQLGSETLRGRSSGDMEKDALFVA